MNTYSIRRTDAPAPLENPWSLPAWQAAPTLAVDQCVGGIYDHQPLVQARVMYDDAALYVAFRVEDQYVRAVAETWHGRVCRDSCVEMFITPGPDTSVGYFNVEVNCGGTMLLHFQPAPAEDIQKMPVEQCETIRIWHELPKIIDPEIAEPTTWQVAYRLPLAILGQFVEVIAPAPGVTWKGNFYKCADQTSHPHWLSWSHIETPGPNFHRPDRYGELRFE